MQVGDKVLYVPDKIHALNVNKDGSLAWNFFRNPGRAGPRLMSKSDVAKSVGMAKRRRTAFETVGSEPACTWPAVVDAIDGDKVTVTIDGPTCQLIYTVPVDPNKAPHTVHPE